MPVEKNELAFECGGFSEMDVVVRPKDGNLFRLAAHFLLCLASNSGKADIVDLSKAHPTRASTSIFADDTDKRLASLVMSNRYPP